MEPIDCVDVEIDSGKRGDDHYRDFGVWIRSGFNEDFFETAHDSALAYQTALILLVECLVAHESTPQTERKLETIIALQALVVKDLDLLVNYREDSQV